MKFETDLSPIWNRLEPFGIGKATVSLSYATGIFQDEKLILCRIAYRKSIFSIQTDYALLDFRDQEYEAGGVRDVLVALQSKHRFLKLNAANGILGETSYWYIKEQGMNFHEIVNKLFEMSSSAKND